MYKKNIIIFLIFITSFSQAQEVIKGKVLDDKQESIPGANVYWENTSIGVVTNDNGEFEIKKTKENSTLIISFIGFSTQKITSFSSSFITVTLKEKEMLQGVTVSKDLGATLYSKTKVTNTQTMRKEELLKAACCNLSESFSTNPSIDVNFTDAVTGNKQIKMLGLASPYILMVEENIPAVRGTSQAQGLSFVPGTWVESIQVTKGAGSVLNGFESISGQINYELIKPIDDIPFFLNAYGSTDSRFELNMHTNYKISDKISTTLLAHGNLRKSKNDNNNDGFLDNPLGQQINVLNRWQYIDDKKGWISFLNIRYMNDEKQAGEVTFNKDTDKFTTNAWGSEINTEKIDVSNKIGYVFPDTPYQSFGFQNSFQHHSKKSYFGLNIYDVEQTSYYSNLLFSSILTNTKNKFTTGINLTLDKYKETVNVNMLTNYNRFDASIGGYFEYTYDNLDNFSAILGARIDKHNRLGTFITPRLHLRYNPWEDTTLRASIGRGKKTANIFAENQQYFASSRNYTILNANGNLYGLDAEIAWNYGLSFLQKFSFFGAKTTLVLDYYRTDFKNKVVVDTDTNSQAVTFYNLNGQSYANSFQAEATISPFIHFNIKTAYKYYDVKTQLVNQKVEQAMQAKHRFFTNVSFETHIKEKGQQWKFDATYNWIGKQRLPNTQSNPTTYRLPDYSNDFSTINAQITRTFSSTFEVYIGGENIGNYKQNKAILSADNPFGSYFDTTYTYAPVFGAMYYAGLRFKIK